MLKTQYNAIKWLTETPQWKEYVAFLEDECRQLLEILPCLSDSEQTWELRTRVRELQRVTVLAQNAVSEFEYAQKEMNQNAK